MRSPQRQSRAGLRAQGASLTLLGTADAFNTGGMGNACYLVEDGAGAVTVDFGPTALLNLKRAGRSPGDLDAVLLTHLHGDHFGGLHLLFIDFQYDSRRTRPFTVVGPVGTEKKVEAWYRLAYGSTGRKRTYGTRYVELGPGEALKLGGRRVETFRANHMEPKDGALHLKLTTGGVSLGFTGDTGWSDELVRLADGLDLLVSECTNLEDGPGQHLSWEQLEVRLAELRARRIVLSHLGSLVRPRVGQLRAPRHVRFAEDFATLDVRPR